jgi:hypothetical protein
MIGVQPAGNGQDGVTLGIVGWGVGEAVRVGSPGWGVGMVIVMVGVFDAKGDVSVGSAKETIVASSAKERAMLPAITKIDINAARSPVINS